MPRISRSVPLFRALLALVLCLASLACAELPFGLGGQDVRTMYVGPQLVDCMGSGPRTCMLVKTHPDAEWQLFYDGIEGFTFEPGFTYVLRVAVRRIDNPPADGSSLAYHLVKVLEKRPETAQD